MEATMKIKFAWLLLCAAVLILVAGRNAVNSDPTTPSPRVRIGVFQPRALALAYWRSDAGLNQIHDAVNQARTAKQNGCSMMQLQALEGNCRTLQDHMMAQAFGGAPIDDVLAKLQDVLPKVAQKDNVVAIVPQLSFKTDSVEAVDVTDDLAAPFKPSAQTYKMMCDLSQQPPASLKVANGN
jgi:hypothetical protein